MNRYDLAKKVVDFFRGLLPEAADEGQAEEPARRVPVIVSYHYTGRERDSNQQIYQGFGSFLHWARNYVDPDTLWDELNAACLSDCRLQKGMLRSSCDIIAVSPLPVQEVEDGGE